MTPVIINVALSLVILSDSLCPRGMPNYIGMIHGVKCERHHSGRAGPAPLNCHSSVHFSADKSFVSAFPLKTYLHPSLCDVAVAL